MRPKQWNNGGWTTLTQSDNYLLINLWFLNEYLMKFNDIFYKYKTELFWFDGMIFVPLIRTEILHFSDISLGGQTLGTPVYINTSIHLMGSFHRHFYTNL